LAARRSSSLAIGVNAREGVEFNLVPVGHEIELIEELEAICTIQTE